MCVNVATIYIATNILSQPAVTISKGAVAMMGFASEGHCSISATTAVT